ncbi:hypothetical protein C4Z12_015500, partial [Klebsiella pneumoniae subsp. pneumoniae]
GTVCVVGKMRDLILQLSKSSIYSTKPPCTTIYTGNMTWLLKLKNAIPPLLSAQLTFLKMMQCY